MNNENLVSILMPTYNVEKFILSTIDSILKQTYENWELVIVDDKSTDKTDEILLDYKNKDNRIRFFRNELNLGFTKNVNKAFNLACGKYCVKFDADDLMRDDFLEKLLNGFYNDSIGHVTAADNVTIDGEGSVIEESCPFWKDEFSKYFGLDLNNSQFIEFPSSYIPRFFLTNYALGGLTGTMFKLSDAKQVGFFDERFKWASDFDFTLKLCSLASRKAFCMEPIWSYRKLSFSNTSRFKKQGVYLLEQNYLIERVFELFTKELDNKEYKIGVDKWLNNALKYNIKYGNKDLLLKTIPNIFNNYQLSRIQSSKSLINNLIIALRML